MEEEEYTEEVRNIAESDSFDEAEKKMNQIAEEYKQKNPNSIRRPETANRGTLGAEKKSEDSDVKKIYEKISDFFLKQSIHKEQFYDLENAFLTKEEFAERFKDIGLFLKSSEIDTLFDDLAAYTTRIELEPFYAKLSCWNKPKESKDKIISKLNSDILEALSRTKRVRPKGKRKKLKSCINQGTALKKKDVHVRPATTSVKKQILFNTEIKSQRRQESKVKPNYLLESKERNEQEKDKLENLVTLAKRKQEFDCFQKIQEANELARILDKGYSFNTSGKAETGISIFQTVDMQQLTLTQEEFLREHRKLKREEESLNMVAAQGRKPRLLSMMDSSRLTMQETLLSPKECRADRIRRITNISLEAKKAIETLDSQLKALEIKGIRGEYPRKQRLLFYINKIGKQL